MAQQDDWFSCKLKTEFIQPPIPDRSHDWVAWMDGKDETGPFGYGRTKEEAIRDLQDQSWEDGLLHIPQTAAEEIAFTLDLLKGFLSTHYAVLGAISQRGEAERAAVSLCYSCLMHYESSLRDVAEMVRKGTPHEPSE